MTPCDAQLVCPRTSTGAGAVCGEAMRGLAGAPCSDDRMCVPGLYCDPASSRCAARLAEGSACSATFACADGLWCRGYDPAGVPGKCEAPHAMATCAWPSVPLGRDGCLDLVESCTDAGSCTRLGHDGSLCAGPGSSDCAYIPATWCPLGSNLPPSVDPYTCRSVGGAGAACLLYNDCLDHVCDGGHCQ